MDDIFTPSPVSSGSRKWNFLKSVIELKIAVFILHSLFPKAKIYDDQLLIYNLSVIFLIQKGGMSRLAPQEHKKSKTYLGLWKPIGLNFIKIWDGRVTNLTF